MPKIPYSISSPMPRKAALRASPAVDEPNVVLPLATSINERGVAGYTHAINNSEDQRKINCFYEPVKNAVTGKGTLTLSKRPGITIDTNTYGASTQTPYLVIPQLLGSVSDTPVVFSVSVGGAVTASIVGTTTNVIASPTSHVPCFVDKTKINNVENIVFQTRITNVGGQRAFYSTDVANIVWTEIIDADYTGLFHRGKLEHLDGYAFILTGQNLIVNSDLNSLVNWTATSFLAKQIRQDFAVGLARLSNQLLAFGEDTVEVFFNNGNTTGSPLGRLAHLHQKIGLINTASGGINYYATVENRLYFVGRRSGGQFSVGVFMFDGSRFEKVSTPFIDKILSQKANSIYSVNQIGHHGQSAVAICWTAPAASTQQWAMFYPDWKDWFIWESSIFSPTNSGSWFLGTTAGSLHKIYNFPSSDNWQDDGTSFAWSTQFKLPTNGSARRFMPMYGVDADTDTSANNLTVEISTDDSKTFSTLGTIDQTQDRKVLFRGGSFRKAHIRLGNTNARPTRIHNFLARLE